MKKFLVILFLLFISTTPANAQMSGMMEGQTGMSQEGQQMPMIPMMQKCQQMMIGHGMQMHEMMHMMMDMIKIQRKMMRGMSTAEKKEAIQDMDKMMERMEKMMSEMRNMMRSGMMPIMPEEPKKEGEIKKETSKPEPLKH